MTELYIQDTSFWVLTHRRGAPTQAIQRSRGLLENSTFAINEMIRLEVLGAYKDEALAAEVSDELDALEFLELSRPVWDETRRLSSRLKLLGQTKGLPDLLIAATAIHYDAVLLHAYSDFETIAQHSDLRTESYLAYLDT